MQYEQNRYWLESGWLDLEPTARDPGEAAKRAGLGLCPATIRAARKGGEDVSLDPSRHRRHTKETRGSERRVSEVRVRGSDSGCSMIVVEDSSTEG